MCRSSLAIDRYTAMFSPRTAQQALPSNPSERPDSYADVGMSLF